MNSETIKACIAAYWRYERQCPLVAFEASSRLDWGWGEQADVLAVNKERYLIETEVKVSISDFRKDKHKPRHRYFRNENFCSLYPTAYFYFAVPKEIANQVSLDCDQIYPYAGVLGCPKGTDEQAVEIYRNPKRLSGKRLSIKQVIYMVRSQTATLCRLAKKVDEQARLLHTEGENG